MCDVIQWLIFRRLSSFTVTGNSMLPTLAPGDRVLVACGRDDRWTMDRLWNTLVGGDPPSCLSQSVQVGDIVVCEHPLIRDTQIIKRVGQFGCSSKGVRTMVLYGDNHLDGESNGGNGLFGEVSLKLCVGKVMAFFPHPH